MENQHRKIRGYRELSQEEIDLMNEIKKLGESLDYTVRKVELYLHNQRLVAEQQAFSEDIDVQEHASDELDRLADATPARFAALGKTDLQTGLMYLTRAVAQPTFF